jgi:predicted amidophosphoribosyltransferase
MRTSIHRFKYRGEYARGRFLGRLLADYAESTLARPKELAEIVVPVPLHVRRRRARGYNQAEILATPVAEQLSLSLSLG